MVNRPAAASKQKAYWGSGLAIAGFLALTANLLLATPLTRIVVNSRTGFAGTVSTFGVSVLRGAAALALGQVDYFSLTLRILVLFSAMLAVIFGIALMRSHARTTGKVASTSSTLNEEETN